MQKQDTITAVPGLLADRAACSPDAPALYVRSDRGQWQATGWQDGWTRVRRAARHMRALGLQPGDTLAILSHTCREWMIAEYAGMLAGAVIVGIEPHATPEHMAHILRHSCARALIVDKEDNLQKVPAVLMEQFRFVAQIGGRPARHGNTEVLPWGAFGGTSSREDAAWDWPNAESPAVLIYTSGTTGTPKAIAYTHGQLLTASRAILEAFPQVGESDRVACWLPMSHLFQRMLNLVAVGMGARIYFVEDPRQIMPCLREMEPTVVVGVPRFFEKVYEAIQGRLATVPSFLRHAVSRLLRGRLRSLFGRNIRFLITGSAPCPRHILDFFHAAGLPLLEAYGISENAVPMAVNTCTACRLGSVGRVLPQNEIRLTRDGEILVRGSGVFRGYDRDPDSRDSFTEDGFYRTGDRGWIDDDGFLFLKGRKSDIIKTSTGRRISPAGIEQLCRTSPHIEQAVVVGNGQKHLAALLTLKALSSPGPDPDALADPRLQQHICEEVERLNERLPSHERLHAFAVLPGAFSIRGGEVTPTLKLRRAFIEKRYEGVVNRLFGEPVRRLSSEEEMRNEDHESVL